MATSLARVFEIILSPSPAVFIFGFLIILLTPILVHLALVRSSRYTSLPTVLVIGTSSAGKTALVTLFERGPAKGPAPSRTSLTPLVVELSSSPGEGFENASKGTTNVAGVTAHTKFLLVDLPGHGKLRAQALSRLESKAIDEQKLRGVVFVVDSSTLMEEDALRETGDYLHSVLLALQRAAHGGLTRRQKTHRVPVLVAANKLDLFTALPPSSVQTKLEAELTRIRTSKTKSLLDSSVREEEIQSEEQEMWLGEYGSDNFSFTQMEEFGIEVEVLGGSTTSNPSADHWWTWMSEKVAV